MNKLENELEGITVVSLEQAVAAPYCGVLLANSGARLILQPDWETITWTEDERKKGQAWGLKTIESFHTYGTPPNKE